MTHLVRIRCCAGSHTRGRRGDIFSALYHRIIITAPQVVTQPPHAPQTLLPGGSFFTHLKSCQRSRQSSTVLRRLAILWTTMSLLASSQACLLRSKAGVCRASVVATPCRVANLYRSSPATGGWNPRVLKRMVDNAKPSSDKHVTATTSAFAGDEAKGAEDDLLVTSSIVLLPTACSRHNAAARYVIMTYVRAPETRSY